MYLNHKQRLNLNLSSLPLRSWRKAGQKELEKDGGDKGGAKVPWVKRWPMAKASDGRWWRVTGLRHLVPFTINSASESSSEQNRINFLTRKILSFQRPDQSGKHGWSWYLPQIDKSTLYTCRVTNTLVHADRRQQLILYFNLTRSVHNSPLVQARVTSYAQKGGWSPQEEERAERHPSEWQPLSC